MMIHDKYEHTKEYSNDGHNLSFERYSDIVSKWTVWKDENYFKRNMTLKPRTSLSFFYQSVSSETKQHCIHLYQYIKDKPNDILWNLQAQKKPIQRDCTFYGKTDSYCTIMSKLMLSTSQDELISARVSHFYEVFEFHDNNRPYELTYEYRNIINLYEAYFPDQPKLKEAIYIDTFQQIIIQLVTKMYQAIQVEKEKERMSNIIARQDREKEKRIKEEEQIQAEIKRQRELYKRRYRNASKNNKDNTNKKGIKRHGKSRRKCNRFKS